MSSWRRSNRSPRDYSPPKTGRRSGHRSVRDIVSGPARPLPSFRCPWCLLGFPSEAGANEPTRVRLGKYSVRHNFYDEQVKIRWARSATRHRIKRSRSQYVIENCGLIFDLPPPASDQDERLLFLGDDQLGIPLEVMAVELQDGDLYVIRVMRLRDRYRAEYEEAKRWRA
jgi:hypothetical protein